MVTIQNATDKTVTLDISKLALEVSSTGKTLIDYLPKTDLGVKVNGKPVSITLTVSAKNPDYNGK